MLRGIDVSHHQGSVNWADLKRRYGLTWGAAKAAEGVSFTDSQFGANWAKMKAAGLVRMAYYFARPGGDPVAAAKFFLSYVNRNGGFGAGDIACMDLESNPNNLPMLALRDWLAAWADTVTRATGRKPFLYTGSGYIANNATLNLRSHYAAWWFPKYPTAYARHTTWPLAITGWPSRNNWGGAPDIWQFSETFAGQNLDASIANMSLADLRTRGTSAAQPPAGNKPVPPATTQTGAKSVADWTEAQLRAMMQAEEEEYAIRFWIDPTGTGTALRGQVTYILNQIPILQNKLDTLLAEHAPAAKVAAADLQPEVDQLHAAMNDAVSELSARPLAAQAAEVLNAPDGDAAPATAPADAPQDSGTTTESGSGQ